MAENKDIIHRNFQKLILKSTISSFVRFFLQNKAANLFLVEKPKHDLFVQIFAISIDDVGFKA